VLPIAVEDFDVDKLRAIAQETIGLYGGGVTTLVGKLCGILNQNGQV
jgi:hypothetical protein